MIWDTPLTRPLRPRGSLETLLALHSRQGLLCQRLEDIADQLPSSTPRACLEAAWSARILIGPLHAVEETCFFPLLESRLPASLQISISTARSRQEHVEDRDAALDIIVNLKRLAAGCSRPEIDLISYQLRSFFVAMRRHEAREQEILFPRALEVFTVEDESLLQEALVRCFGQDRSTAEGAHAVECFWKGQFPDA